MIGSGHGYPPKVPQPGARVIVLQGCRNGNGCSHLAVNLAVILMGRGYRVGLLDMDPRSGGMRTLLGLDHTLERDLASYWWLEFTAQSKTTLRADWRAYGKPSGDSKPGLYVPPIGGQWTAESSLLEFFRQRYCEQTAGSVLQQLTQELRLDYLLVDNQPQINRDTLLSLSLADVVLVLMQLHPYEMQHTAVILNVVQQFHIETVYLAPTLVLPTVDRGAVQQEIEATYGYPIVGFLALSEAMSRLASQGIFCLHFPIHELTQTMEAIAHNLEQPGPARGQLIS